MKNSKSLKSKFEQLTNDAVPSSLNLVKEMDAGQLKAVTGGSRIVFTYHR